MRIVKIFTLSPTGLSFTGKLFLAAAFLFTMTACNDKDVKSPGADTNLPAKKVVVPKIDFSALSKNDFFEISKDGCMSGCPFFTMRVNGDGAFEFRDFWYGTTARPPVLGKISPENTKKLFQKIKEFGFEEFSASKIRCQVYKSDQTTENMQLVVAEKKYSIEYNLGCTDFENAAKLHQFEDQINSILDLDHLSDHRR